MDVWSFSIGQPWEREREFLELVMVCVFIARIRRLKAYYVSGVRKCSRYIPNIFQLIIISYHCYNIEYEVWFRFEASISIIFL